MLLLIRTQGRALETSGGCDIDFDGKIESHAWNQKTFCEIARGRVQYVKDTTRTKRCVWNRLGWFSENSYNNDDVICIYMHFFYDIIDHRILILSDKLFLVEKIVLSGPRTCHIILSLVCDWIIQRATRATNRDARIHKWRIVRFLLQVPKTDLLSSREFIGLSSRVRKQKK